MGILVLSGAICIVVFAVVVVAKFLWWVFCTPVVGDKEH